MLGWVTGRRERRTLRGKVYSTPEEAEEATNKTQGGVVTVKEAWETVGNDRRQATA